MSDTETRPKPGPRVEGESAEQPEHPSDQAAEQRSDQAAERGADQGSDQAAERGADQSAEHDSDPSAAGDDGEAQATDISQVVEAAAKAGYGDSSDGQDYLDRDKMPYDPAEGLYSGTAVEGTSEIAGPHQHQDDIGDTSEDSQAKAAELAAERPEAAQGASTPEGNVGKTEGND